MTRAGRWRSLWPLAATLATACATAKPPATAALPPPAKVAAPSVRLAWMPLEPRAAPEIATVVNERLARVVVDGVTQTFQAPVSMEMAQLALECIDHKPACYGKVGRSVGADRLVWAELDRGRGGAVKVRVLLFDVARVETLREGARVFQTAKAAGPGGAALVDEVFAVRAAQAGGAP